MLLCMLIRMFTRRISAWLQACLLACLYACLQVVPRRAGGGSFKRKVPTSQRTEFATECAQADHCLVALSTSSRLSVLARLSLAGLSSVNFFAAQALCTRNASTPATRKHQKQKPFTPETFYTKSLYTTRLLHYIRSPAYNIKNMVLWHDINNSGRSNPRMRNTIKRGWSSVIVPTHETSTLMHGATVGMQFACHEKWDSSDAKVFLSDTFALRAFLIVVIFRSR